MTYQGYPQGNGHPGYRQPSQGQMYGQPMVVIPQHQPRGDVQNFASTSLHPYQASPASYQQTQQSHYQQSYQNTWAPESYAQAVQQHPQYQQSPQYYQQQQVQQAPPQGYYQPSAPQVSTYQPALKQHQPSHQQPARPQQRPSSQQSTSVPAAAQHSRPQQRSSSQQQAPGSPKLVKQELTTQDVRPQQRSLAQQQTSGPSRPVKQEPSAHPSRPQQRSSSHQQALRPPKAVKQEPTAQLAAPQAPSQQAPPLQSRQPSIATNPQQRTAARVEIPAQQSFVSLSDLEMPRSAKRRKSNEGEAILADHGLTPQQSSKPHRLSQVHQPAATSSPLTELTFSQVPPTPKSEVDYYSVLLALADEYVTAAHDMSGAIASSDFPEEKVHQYYHLMATAVGCLESVLKSYRQSDPRKEARVRLHLASLLLEETENSEQAEEVLSKGIALCERNKLSDLKYAMHHLLARVISKSKPKAAMKSLDKLIDEVGTLKVMHWSHAFRLLRITLAFQASIAIDFSALLKHLTAAADLAAQYSQAAIQIMVAALETIVHLRSGSADAVELAQRSLAAARMHQLGPEMQALPQIRALLDCLDLACAIMQHNPDRIMEKVHHMQGHFDEVTRDRGFGKGRNFAVSLGYLVTDSLVADSAGIFVTAGDGTTALALAWLDKCQLYSLGYMLSGIAYMHKNAGESKAMSFLGESSKLVGVNPDSMSQSISAVTDRLDWQQSMGTLVHLQIALAHGSRAEWSTVADAVQKLPDAPLVPDTFTRASLIYLDAISKHGMGDLKAADSAYSSSELAFEYGSRTALKDLQAVTTLNRILVLREFKQTSEADTLLSSVEMYCLTHSNKALVSAYYIIKSSPKGSAAIIKTKQYLQSAVQAAKAASNGQLLAIVMSLMTQLFFTNIVGEQAVKSARAARTLALKTDKLWLAVADEMYGNTLTLIGEHREATIAKEEALECMESLPPAVQQRFIDG